MHFRSMLFLATFAFATTQAILSSNASSSVEAPAESSDKSSAEIPTQAVPQAAPNNEQPQPLNFTESDVDTVNGMPQPCFTFSSSIMLNDYDLKTYVSVTPQGDYGWAANDGKICISGLKNGETYNFTFLKGLSGADGSALAEDVTQSITLPDHEPVVNFKGDGTILANQPLSGLPLLTTNVRSAKIKVIRINDRSLVNALVDNDVGRTLYGYRLDRLQSSIAEKVYEGSLDIESQKNTVTTTLIPVKDILKKPKPGIYAVTITSFVSLKDSSDTDSQPVSEDTEDSGYNDVPTQWFVLTNIGLSAFKSGDGLLVTARDLITNKLLPNLDIQLYAINNELLGQAKTDDRGIAHFANGLLRGEESNAPRLLVAQDKNGASFSYLDLSDSKTIALNDRGSTGRTQPEDLDAYIVTERGVYRPGETIHATVLLRDLILQAPLSQPIIAEIYRPNGALAQTLQLDAPKQGGYTFDYPTSNASPGGTWSIDIKTDPKLNAIGHATFQVEDFQPPRLEMTITPSQPYFSPNEQNKINIAANFLYGAPAQNLQGDGTLFFSKAVTPFEKYADYQFGLEQEQVENTQTSLETFETDEHGKAEVTIPAELSPDSSAPLLGRVVVNLYDIGGRPINAQFKQTIFAQDLYLGISSSGKSFAENTQAQFKIIALDEKETLQERPHVQWTLYREDTDYIWSTHGSRWFYEPRTISTEVSSGHIALNAQTPTPLNVTLKDASYRLEVRDLDNSKIASSYRFYTGWWNAPQKNNEPDAVTITSDAKRPARPNGNVTVHINSPYLADATILAATGTLSEPLYKTLSPTGQDITLAVPANAVSGFYVLVSAVQQPGKTDSTPDKNKSPLRRALGVKWIPLDTSDKQLAVSIEAPTQITPSQTVLAKVHVDGIKTGSAYVTLSAVDDGILQLTDYQSPNPSEWFLSQKQLAVKLYDVYDALIDASIGKLGRLREGADDIDENSQLKNLPKQTTEVVSLFSGIVDVVDGVAQIPLTIPDFNGRLRLMAMAWTKSQTGQTQQDMTVRSPLVADLMMPRFLAPNDKAKLTLSLNNLDLPEQQFTISVKATTPLQLNENSEQKINLKPGQQAAIPMTISATEVGDGALQISINGEAGNNKGDFSLTREFNLSVRTPNPTTAHQQITIIAPHASQTLSIGNNAPFVAGTFEGALHITPALEIDTLSLFKNLLHYPYGCSEQTTSTALALLYGPTIGLDADSMDIKHWMNVAVSKLADRQQSNGAIGLWDTRSSEDLWLSAYIGDFLTRLRKENGDVPAPLMNNLLSYLGLATERVNQDEYFTPSLAYAFYVLAKNQAITAPDLQYFADTYGEKLTSRLAQVHVLAALKMIGDQDRYNKILPLLDQPLASASTENMRRHYTYGSLLRDEAATITIEKEENIVDPSTLALRLNDLATKLSQSDDYFYYSTQEKIWLIMAKHAFGDNNKPFTINVDSQPFNGIKQFARTFTQNTTLTVENKGDTSIYASTTTSSVSKDLSSASSTKDFGLTRKFYHPNGEEISSLSYVHQNDLLVVVIEGNSQADTRENLMLVDMLPAGFEIENVRLFQNDLEEGMTWLGDNITDPDSVEMRADRYLAALTLHKSYSDTSSPFKVVYLVRAVTPGTFVLPGSYIEDMYIPSHYTRLQSSIITVLGAGEEAPLSQPTTGSSADTAPGASTQMSPVSSDTPSASTENVPLQTPDQSPPTSPVK